MIQEHKLTRTDHIILAVIALPANLAVIALSYLIKKVVKLLYRFKKQLYKLLLTITTVFFLTNVFGVVAHAPHADASVPYVGTPTTEHEQIVAYIEETFGKDAPKAFQLLHGNGKCSGENGGLNPQARNWNSDGSIDYGVMQLNDHWWGFKQYVNNVEMLFDYRINILIAHHIYVNDGNTFKAWTGGKCQGI